MSENRWLPLESNPDVMNEYVRKLGVPEPWRFHDVYGFDPDLLAMVPTPVLAVLLLYPISKQSEKTMIGEVDKESDVYFIKQNIGNACGTIGLIHALCNNSKTIDFEADKHLKEFHNKTEKLSAEARAEYLKDDEGFKQAHEQSAKEGQTAAPPREEKVDLHFVAFVHHKGKLYELDGRKDGPTNHGPTSPGTLLEDTVTVVQKFMARDPENLNFTVVALA